MKRLIGRSRKKDIIDWIGEDTVIKERRCDALVGFLGSLREGGCIIGEVS